MREDADLTQEKLAELTAIGVRSLQRYEAGSRKITLDVFCRMVIICKFTDLAPILQKVLGPVSKKQQQEGEQEMQVGQQNASIAAYRQNNVKPDIAAVDATKTNDTSTASKAPQASTIVAISAQAQTLAESDTTTKIGNGTGKPPLNP